MRYISVAAAFILALGALPALAFDFSDARALVSVAQPRISPDGEKSCMCAAGRISKSIEPTANWFSSTCGPTKTVS